MPGIITHSWNGTVLTISSDSGTSSVDLKGDIGPRGPQGPAGISIGEGGDVDLSNYYTKAQTDRAIEEALEDFEPSGTDVDLTNYYTKTETDNKFATKTEVTTATSGLATETFVTNKIAEAQLSGGEGGDIDLSGYATKDDLNNYRRLDNDYYSSIKLTDGSNTLLRMNAWGIGSDTNNIFWISCDGTGAFATSLTLDGKPVATQEYVTQAVNDALAALDGDEEEY